MNFLFPFSFVLARFPFSLILHNYLSASHLSSWPPFSGPTVGRIIPLRSEMVFRRKRHCSSFQSTLFLNYQYYIALRQNYLATLYKSQSVFLCKKNYLRDILLTNNK